jgi:hypothetical protein
MVNSAEIIRSEYFKKAIKSTLLITLLLGIAISYIIINYIPNSHNSNLFLMSWENKSFTIDLFTSWVLFSTSAFLVVYLLRSVSLKFTPSLVSYLEKEASFIGFKFQRKFDSVYLFFLMNLVSISILYVMDIISAISYIYEGTYIALNPFVRNIILIYLFASLIVPIIWAFLNDRFVIKVKDNVYVRCNLRYSLKRNKKKVPEVLGIILTSNKLCSKFDKNGKHVHNSISELRWLPRKEDSSPFLYFKEFSIPYNFQKQFLNIVMALKEWETKYDSNMDMLNYYFSREFPYHKYKIKKYHKNDELTYLKFSNF